MRRPIARGGVLAALVAVSAVLLSACGDLPASWTASVPTTGPVAQGEQIGLERQDQFIRVIARGPRPGMTPEQVVRGFLDASASFDGDQRVAREFLTASASRRWSPSAGVSVYEGEALLAGTGAVVTLTAAHAGDIEADGTYVASAPDAALTKGFSLVRDGGEWRIDDVPQGLVLSSADVRRAYRALSVYFFDPSYATLVPDARMVPVLGSGVATSLVRMLLGGPSSWLAPAVRTAIPDDLTLALATVPIESGIAQVGFNAAAAGLDERTRQLVSQQVVWTLRQVPDILAIDMTAGGLPWPVQGVSSPQPRDAWPTVDPTGLTTGATGFVASGAQVLRLTSGGAIPVDGQAGAAGPSFVDIAVSADMSALAGTDPESSLWRGEIAPNAPVTRIVADCLCTNPVFDRSGRVWAVRKGAVVSFDDGGSMADIPVLGLDPAFTVAQVVPSRDGTRAALVVSGPEGLELRLARILRSTISAPPSISAPQRLAPLLTNILDVAWSGADSLAVLGGTAGGAVSAFDVDLATGSVTVLDAPEDPVAIAAAPGLATLVVSVDGIVSERRNDTWQERLEGNAAAYPS